jgi:pheromone shutdown protein TraB
VLCVCNCICVQTLEELEGQGDVVAVVGAGHVRGMKQFWEERQQRMRQEGGIPVEESGQLHTNLQLHPGMQLPDGRTYTTKMLRYGIALLLMCVGRREVSLGLLLVHFRRQYAASVVKKLHAQ